MFTRLKLWYKVKFNKPIYRVDILRYAKIIHKEHIGLCHDLSYSFKKLLNVRVWGYPNLHKFIPLFGVNVESFNGDKSKGYWWKAGVWDTGRMAYLDWLIDRYKNYKTNLRDIILL